MTHQRVMRFDPLFESHDAALGFAQAQAVAWIDQRFSGPAPARAE